MALSPFNDSIQINAPKSLDNKYTKGLGVPHNSLAEATAHVIQAYRSRGLTQLINVGGIATEFWYRDGTSDIHLIPKISPGIINYTAENGISLIGNTFKLGAPLTSFFTIINGNNKNFYLSDSQSSTLESITGTVISQFYTGGSIARLTSNNSSTEQSGNVVVGANNVSITNTNGNDKKGEITLTNDTIQIKAHNGEDYAGDYSDHIIDVKGEGVHIGTGHQDLSLYLNNLPLVSTPHLLYFDSLTNKVSYEIVPEPNSIDKTDYTYNLTGVFNGINTVFQTTTTFISGSTKVYLNGVRLTPGAFYDYTETSTNTITLTIAPEEGETLTIDYKT